MKIAVKTAVSVFGSSSSKKLIILGSDELNKLQEIISSDNIQIIHGGSAPNVIPGGNNLFPPKMPSSNYALKGEKLNIITEEAYKEMCLNSNPYKPFIISQKYQEKWNKEKEKEKEKEKQITSSNISITRTGNSEKEIEERKNEEKKIMMEEQINLIKKQEENRIINKENNRNYILNFLREFELEEYKIIDISQDNKYSFNKQNINISKFTSFFDKIPKCSKICI